MAATGKQMNWSAVGFTPLGGSLIAFNSIDDVSVDSNGTLLKYSGDADLYNTTIVNNMNDPTASLNCSNPAQFMNLACGTVGTFTATHRDAKNATGGGIVYTLINAVVDGPSTTGAHAGWGTASLSFSSFSSDGLTSPLGIARV